MAGSTVYVPVDSYGDSMRPVLNRDEAEKLIDSIPQIPMLTIINEKLTEQAYRDSMKTNKCEEWVRVIKTIYLRKQKRLQSGRKVTAVAEENLYGELAVALGIGRNEVEGYIARSLDERPVCETAEIR